MKPIDDSKNEERKNSENSRPESRQSGVSNKSKQSGVSNKSKNSKKIK